ncbi:hypothetical protein ACFPFV_02150 [Salinicoccus siamensis]|uniref:Aminoglycoside phosphotransferase domain-containing protein n=1 Tax=Salinicoccus siamensis TaxID=381830 RepID=A0ABV5Z4H6_9STAP
MNIIIKYIYAKRKRINVLKKNLFSFQKYLVAGKYTLTVEGKNICYLDSIDARGFLGLNNSHLSDGLEGKYQVKYILKKIINFIFIPNKIKVSKLESCNEHFCGSLIMLTRQGDKKIFNFKDKIILNIISEKEKYERIKVAHNSFSNYINSTIFDFDDSTKTYKEKLIDFESFNSVSEVEKNYIIKEFFTNYNNYFISLDKSNLKKIKVENLLTSFYEENNNILLYDKLVSHFKKSNMFDITFPQTLLLGDMCFFNILKTSDKTYYIDFEYSDEYIFFYDFMNILFVEFNRKNPIYLMKYLNGEYDKNLEKTFQIFDLDFCIDKREQYFIMFLLERIALDKKMNGGQQLNEKYYMKIFKVLSYLESKENIY